MGRPILFFDFDDTISDHSKHLESFTAAFGGEMAMLNRGTAAEWSSAISLLLKELELLYITRFCNGNPEGYGDWIKNMRSDFIKRLYHKMRMPLSSEAYDMARRSERNALHSCEALFPGMKNVLINLHELGYPLHLASGNHSEYLKAALAGAGLTDKIGILFGPDLIDYAKEGSEYYSRLFKQADVAAQHAIVIDNDPMALKWAQDAGAFTIQVHLLPHKPIHKAPGTFALITDPAEILPVIQNILFAQSAPSPGGKQLSF